MEWTELVKYEEALEAHIAKTELEDAGIVTFLKVDHDVHILHVMDHEEKKATKLLRSFYKKKDVGSRLVSGLASIFF